MILKIVAHVAWLQSVSVDASKELHSSICRQREQRKTE